MDYSGGDGLDGDAVPSPLKGVRKPVVDDEGSDTDFQDKEVETDVETGEETDQSNSVTRPTIKGKFQSKVVDDHTD